MTINDLRAGVTVAEAGDPWIVLETDFMKKAQRRPVLRTKIRNLRTGAVKERTFKQGDSIPEAEVAKVKATYLHHVGGDYAFMDEATFEQYILPEAAAGDATPFLKEGTPVELITYQGSPVSVQLPIKMTLTVTAAPPGVRGDSASNILKEVEVEGGLKLKAPLFVREGDRIIVDTRTRGYVGKASG